MERSVDSGLEEEGFCPTKAANNPPGLPKLTRPMRKGLAGFFQRILV
jgi:hypothetical protein